MKNNLLMNMVTFILNKNRKNMNTEYKIIKKIHYGRRSLETAQNEARRTFFSPLKR
jgi:hypothetical protein